MTRRRTPDAPSAPPGGPRDPGVGSAERRGSFAVRGAGRLRELSAAAGLAFFFLGACSEGGGTRPDTLRFGQVGDLQVVIETPLGADNRGRLLQELAWESSGPWTLTEEISYRGRVGDVDVRTSQGNSGTFSSAYASLITLINESSSVRLFTEELSQDLEPECGVNRTRVTVRVRDESRNEVARWTRCTVGTLETLAPESAGPDAPAAARVVQAGILARDFSLGESFRSVYHGSVPFGTLDRGADSRASLDESRLFYSDEGRVPEDWNSFWLNHAGGDFTPPEVDWSEEMVIAGAVGTRENAGDSVEVRRILSVDDGSLVELLLRVPGDFCSPAARTHVPFHVVVAPRTPSPVRVVELPTELLPCGT